MTFIEFVFYRMASCERFVPLAELIYEYDLYLKTKKPGAA